jgi:thiamine-phosphate pyrophosphorylase
MPTALPGQYPLYFVTDHSLNAGRPKVQVIASALQGGVKLIQYRDKILGDAEFEKEARLALDLCRRHGATLLINDRVEIARRIGAHGVHLGQGDGSPKAAREYLGPQALLGLSTHDESEVRAAQDLPLNYINIGPVFPTGTKEHAQALGPEEVLRLAAFSTLPWTTMGGIKKNHLADLFGWGARTVAMVSEISLADNIEQRVASILAEISGFA